MRIKFLLVAILNLTIALTLLTGCKKESSIDPSSDPTLSKSIGVTPIDQLQIDDTYWVIYNRALVQVKLEAVEHANPQQVNNLIYNTDDGALAMPFKKVLNTLPNNGNGTYFRRVQYGFTNKLKNLRQFYSESEILAAATGKDPIIKIGMTDIVYKVSFVK
jgi:hypothetical protein